MCCTSIIQSPAAHYYFTAVQLLQAARDRELADVLDQLARDLTANLASTGGYIVQLCVVSVPTWPARVGAVG